MAEYEIEVKCKNCGKAIAVLAPSRWGYKKRRSYGGGWDYFCTWKCLREDEKKKESKKKAVTEEKQTAAYRDREAELRKLIREVKSGKDPYEYLKKEGYSNPKDTMRRLRLQAKDEWPELYTEMVSLGLKDMRKGNGKKGANQVGQNKMTPENKAQAVDIAIAGGDYIKHLKECGAGNPHASWSYIKQQLAREDPVKYDELMAALKKEAVQKGIVKPTHGGYKLITEKDKLEPIEEAGHPEKKPEEYKPTPYPKIDRFGIRQETAAALSLTDPEEKPGTVTRTQVVLDSNGLHITKEKEALDYTVTAIKTKAGTFMISEDMKEITWILDGKHAKLGVEKWTALAGTLEDTLRVLGVNI